MILFLFFLTQQLMGGEPEEEPIASDVENSSEENAPEETPIEQNLPEEDVSSDTEQSPDNGSEMQELNVPQAKVPKVNLENAADLLFGAFDGSSFGATDGGGAPEHTYKTGAKSNSPDKTSGESENGNLHNNISEERAENSEQNAAESNDGQNATASTPDSAGDESSEQTCKREKRLLEAKIRELYSLIAKNVETQKETNLKEPEDAEDSKVTLGSNTEEIGSSDLGSESGQNKESVSSPMSKMNSGKIQQLVDKAFERELSKTRKS